MKPLRWLLWLAGAAVLAASCQGADQAAAPAVEVQAQPQTQRPQTKQTQPEPQPAPAAPQDAAPAERPFDPDAVELSQLIFWGPLDGFFGRLLPIPAAGQALLDQLLASDSPAANKYIIDLAAFPNPYWDQVMDYLERRFGVDYRTVYEYRAIFEFDPYDSATPAYLRFKQALFAGSLQEIARFLDPQAARTIDAREVMWGGVNIDGIPPLEFPAQVFPDQAVDWINGTDIVVGIEINGDARAYPIRIIAWHEMVNDTIGGVPVSLAYCTLCGSPILFDGRVGAEIYRFGTSGLLYRSNKLMYDRTTRTLWNQFSGQPAWGELVGQNIRLTPLPTVVTTWAEWHAQHPDTTVLSIATGIARDYSPGAAYEDYFNSPDLWFHAPVQDERLAAKADVYAVRVGDALTAYPIKRLAERQLVNDEVGGLAVVVIATADGSGGRAYESGGTRFAEVDLSAGTLTDADGRNWVIREDSLLGPDGASLARVAGHNAYWFAIGNLSGGGRLWEG